MSIYVIDKPIVKTQRFDVIFPEQRVVVIRKEVVRDAHNTACDVADVHVSYEVFQDVEIQIRSKAINEVEDFIGGKNHYHCHACKCSQNNEEEEKK